MSAPAAWLVAIGDELLLGRGVDTNSAELARRLQELGFAVRGVSICGDGEAEIVRAVRAAAQQSALIVATGGLGPTEDDRTRHAAATLAGVGLEFDADGWQEIEAHFARLQRPVPDSNRRQALLPAGAERLPNENGTAPGFTLAVGASRFVALPGVPREMRVMFARQVEPRMAQWFGPRAPTAVQELQLLGPSEAAAGERIAAWMAPPEPLPVTVGITASGGLLTVRLFARGPDAAAAVQQATAALRPLLAEWLVLEGEGPLAAAVLARLRSHALTLALAESCTGGMLAQQLTDEPGSSAALLAGYVCYSDQGKQRELGVPAELLARHGAVSVEVACAMAEGAARRTGAGVALATTGIAGPAGGSPAKPVGTVCFALWLRGELHGWRLRIADLGREFVRRRACAEAWAALLRALPDGP